jgi:sialate O-acetylesterase
LLTKREIKGDKVILSFSHTDGGLKAKDGALKSFVVAGADKQWHDATAKIEGKNVIVSCADVSEPVAVRYAWKDNPEATLFNGAGLPASQFRTDDWELQLEAVRPVRRVVKKE